MRLRKIFLIFGLIFILSIVGFYFYIQPRYVTPILMYHHINGRGKTSLLSVSPENFTRQMRFLAQHNYNVVSLSTFVRAKQRKEELPPKTVVITFDDGYMDNYYFAYPVLKKHQFPAAIFVITAAVGQPGYLNRTQIREMVSSGIIEIGSHTLNGAYLPGRSLKELEWEIGISKRRLEEWLDKRVDLLCYPIGGFNHRIQEIAKKYGYKAGCTTNRGREQTYLNNDVFALKRIKVKDNNLFVFWAKVSGYYNFFRRVRKPH